MILNMDQDYKRIFRPWASESWNEDVPLINETVLGVVEERQRVTPASEERLPFTKELRSDLPGGHRPNRLESSRAEKTQLSCEMTNLGRSGGQCQKIVMPTVKRPVVPTVVPISRNRYVDGFSNGYDSTGRLQNPSAMSERDKRVCPTSNNPDSQHISNNLYNRTYTQSLMSSGGANGCFAGGRQLIQANYTAYDVMLQQMIHDKLLRKAEQQKKQRPKKFQCPHCRVSFSNNGQLKGHIRIHTGERPFSCDHPKCEKTFTRNEELTRHKRIHTGLKPFSCTICGKGFGRKDHLKKHTRTHQRLVTLSIPPPPTTNRHHHHHGVTTGTSTTLPGIGGTSILNPATSIYANMIGTNPLINQYFNNHLNPALYHSLY